MAQNSDSHSSNLQSEEQHTHTSYIADDEIDLLELFLTLWKGKWIILAFTTVFMLSAIVYNTVTFATKPAVYKANVTLAPIVGTYTELLESLAKDGLSSNNQIIQEARLLLESYVFLETFINERQLFIPLMAGDEWNAQSESLHIDPTLYDVANSQWLSDAPTTEDSYHRLLKALSISQPKKTNFLVLSVTTLSPKNAEQWLAWLVEDFNATLKQSSLDYINGNIVYLTQRINSTQVPEMQAVFYKLLALQEEDKMLLEAQPNAPFKLMDSIQVETVQQTKGRRTLIVFIAILMGGVLGCFVVLFRSILKARKTL